MGGKNLKFVDHEHILSGLYEFHHYIHSHVCDFISNVVTASCMKLLPDAEHLNITVHLGWSYNVNEITTQSEVIQ